MFNVGLVTWDDFNFLLDSKPLFNSSGFEYAKTNGRFYYVFMKWFYSLPYVIDNSFFFSFMHLFPIFIYIFLFVWLIERVFSDRKLTLFAGLLVCLFYQITPWCSITAAHPFYYTFSLSLILIAFHLIYSYFKTNKYYYLLIASIVFACATLFYESYLMFYIVIFIFIVSRYKIKTFLAKENIKKIVLELLPFFIFGALYIVAYFIFTHYFPSTYSGTTISSELTFRKFLSCMLRLNKHAIPPNTFYSYKEYIFPTQTQFIGGSFKTYFLSLCDIGFVSWLKAIIAVYFFIILFYKFSTKISYKQLIFTSLLGFVIAYIPHIPLALTVQFTNKLFSAWVTTGMSFLGFVMVFISVIFAINKLLSFNEIVRKSVSAILIIPLFFITIFVQEANIGVTDDFKRSKLRMDAVDGLLEYYEIQNGGIYYLKNLHNSTSVFSGNQVPWNFWGKYFTMKKGISIKLYENYEKLYNDYSDKDIPVNLAFFEQSAQGRDMLLSIVKCQGTQLTSEIENIICDTIDVGYYSANKKFALSILSDTACDLFVNNSLMRSHNTFHYANIMAHKRNPVTFFSITGKKLRYQTLMVRNFPFENIDFTVVAK